MLAGRLRTTFERGRQVHAGMFGEDAESKGAQGLPGADDQRERGLSETVGQAHAIALWICE